MILAIAEKQADLDTDSFDFLRKKLHELAGIHITDAKSDLVKGRLRRRLAVLEMESFREYVEYLQSLAVKEPEWDHFINAMTTNKTDFFRESEHFTFLTERVIPSWRSSSRSPLRIWSSACSTGEEVYTLAMVLESLNQVNPIEYRISASDIDTEVLATAKKGVYFRSRLSEVPQQYHRNSFSFGTGDIERWVKVNPKLKRSLEFKRCNLLTPPFPWDNPFDVIFCRNVLIYFTPATIQQVINNLFAVAKPGAYLFVGHSESLHNIKTSWEYIQPSIYRKKEK